VNGWILGYIIGAAVVVVVVGVLSTMIVLARRTTQKAGAIVTALHDARDGTAALWQMETTVLTTERIVHAAAEARESLAQGQRR